MPIFEFKCKKCGNIFEELFLKKSNDETVSCPKCFGPAEKIISCSSFILKGPGWGKDGYCKSKSKSNNKNKGDGG